MKYFILTFAVIFLFVSCNDMHRSDHMNESSFHKINQPEEVGFCAKRLARIDSLLQYYVNNGVMPNAVTFVARHGKIVHYKAFGWKNIEKKEPVKLDDIFRNASQTKAITTVGLMMLFEEGKLQLDDPISKYLPEWKNTEVLDTIYMKDTTWKSHPAKNPITVRMLLNHTSGIPYPNAVYKKFKIPDVNSLEDETIKDVSERMAKLPIVNEPGTKWLYGLNLEIAGVVIEVLSGMPLYVYFQKKIFEPLGMTDSYFYLPKEKESRLVSVYSKDSLNGPLKYCTITQNQTYPYSGAKKVFMGGAGLVGTIEDYAKFCQMMLNGGSFNGHQLLGRKTIEMMTRNQIGEILTTWDKNKFGLGFEIFGEGDVTKTLGSVGSYKWGGMYATDYLIDPKEDLIMLIYTNAHPFPNPNVHERFRTLVYQALVD
jgi:CubicO group peptidase (beta-lactamase class C family)